MSDWTELNWTEKKIPPLESVHLNRKKDQIYLPFSLAFQGISQLFILF